MRASISALQSKATQKPRFADGRDHERKQQPTRKPSLGRCRRAAGQLQAEGIGILHPGAGDDLPALCGREVRRGREADRQARRWSPPHGRQGAVSGNGRALSARGGAIRQPAQAARGGEHRPGDQRRHAGHRARESRPQVRAAQDLQPAGERHPGGAAQADGVHPHGHRG